MLTNDRRADLFDGVEYFFNAIKAKCSSDEEYAAELLKARGFLLEDEGIILSDNSHSDDSVYLIGILIEEHLGEVKDGKIIIFPEVNVEKIFYSTRISGSSRRKAEEILYKNNGIGNIAFPARKITQRRPFSFMTDTWIPWKLFIHNSYAPKIPLYLLEPFIGRYVKAISACGVETWCSCDGNHFRRRRKGQILVDISSEPNVIWHEIIRQRLLVKNFKLKWELVSDSECAKIIFDSFDRKDK